MGAHLVFESTPCDLCGSSRSKPIFEGPDRLLKLPGSFRVVQCVNCGLLRQDPRPTHESMLFYYPPEYEPYSIAIDDELSFIRRLDRRYGMLKRRKAVEKYCKGGRLLDVGCATGIFLYEMARTGRWEVEGIEPNPEAANYGRNRFGINIHIGDLMTVDLPNRFYDVITMWNVFEHLHYPMENLKVVARLLKPGGWFIFSIPNLQSLEYRLMGKYWMGWELPRHLYYPTKDHMELMLSRVGLRLREWKCLGGAYFSFLLSLRFWLEEKGRTSIFARLLLSVMGSLAIRIVFSPPFAILTYLNRASIITGFSEYISGSER